MAKDLTIGSLFYGTGALDLAVRNTWGGQVAWLAENDRNVSRIAAWNEPDVPNLGDVTQIDWTKVAPVDILTGGSPCQDLSHAGKKAGMSEGTRSNLWVQMREAVAVLKPSLVVWENVRGALTAPADCDLEYCPRCVGGRRTITLRALGRVLGDLADIGYDARWHGCSASEVGAPHGRFRVFLIAYPTGTSPADPLNSGPDGGGTGEEWGTDPDKRVRTRQLLPTPTLMDMGDNKTVDQWNDWTAEIDAKHHNGNGHGNSLSIEVQRVGKRGHWGRYMAAVQQWERVTRPAPEPLAHNPELGLGQVTPEFVEWMMGLEPGLVTKVPGLARKPAIRSLGNGVVPQQAEAAFRLMCDWPAYDELRR